MFLVVARAHGPGLDGLERGGGVGCGLAGRKAIEARRLDDRRVVLICDIEIDIPGRSIHLCVEDAELAERRKTWVCPEPKIKSGYLPRYAKLVSSADKGAILQ